VHRDIASSHLVATVSGHQDTDLGRQVRAGLVQVGHHMGGLETRYATDLDLLSDGRVGVVQNFLDRLAAHVAGQQLIGAGCPDGDSLREDLAGQRDELVAFGDKVGLAVDLDERADAVAGLGSHEAVGRRATFALGDALETLDAQDLGGLVVVAVGLVQGSLDVHHAGAGRLAKRFDVSGGVVRHRYRSLS
jgi:hypothetical protein